MAASEVRIHRAAVAAAAGGVAGLRYCQVAVALVTPMRRRLLSPDTYSANEGERRGRACAVLFFTVGAPELTYVVRVERALILSAERLSFKRRRRPHV
jgi:hypothetical protein